MNDIINAHPWAAWVFVTCGGLSMLFNTVAHGIPTAVAACIRYLPSLVGFVVKWVMAHPVLKKALKDPATREKVYAILKAINDGLEQIQAAALAEVQKQVEAAEVDAPAGDAAPAPEPPVAKPNPAAENPQP